MIKNTIFNNFLNAFLRNFYACFPQKRTKTMQNSSAWITTGIKTSCNNKRKLYFLCRKSNDPKLKNIIGIIPKHCVKLLQQPKNVLQQ